MVVWAVQINELPPTATHKNVRTCCAVMRGENLLLPHRASLIAMHCQHSSGIACPMPEPPSLSTHQSYLLKTREGTNEVNSFEPFAFCAPRARRDPLAVAARSESSQLPIGTWKSQGRAECMVNRNLLALPALSEQNFGTNVTSASSKPLFDRTIQSTKSPSKLQKLNDGPSFGSQLCKRRQYRRR